ncbi:MAG: type II toxin-antitoxin system YafQ family toxin [Rickettsia endosymbiont of Labidopullus appendiculatus]|nr:type II toxin-antitoxin system YafQ family toxin [Rickettsia endosymbiont of Labidopullus appendiculatus]
MRTIKRTAQFKRDYKREKRRQHGVTLDNDLLKAIKLLVIDAQLPKCMRYHPLIGNWKDHRDCHIKSQLLQLRTVIVPSSSPAATAIIFEPARFTTL